MKTRIPILALFGAAYALPNNNFQRHVYTPEHHVVHQFANPTWVENIAIRPNGNLLVTLLTTPEIYSLDPHASNTTAPILIHSFAAAGDKGVLGITQTTPDVFYAIVGNISILSGDYGFNTFGVWAVDLSQGGEAVVELVTDMPDVVLPNGIACLDGERGLLVVADSFGGGLALVDVRGRSYRLFLKEKEMAPPNGTIGINGIRVVPPRYTGNATSRGNAKVFFSNTGSQMLYSMDVSLDNLERVGDVELMAKAQIDDFAVAVDDRGEAETVYAAGNGVNSLLKIELQGGRKGEVQVLLGGLNETVLAGPSSVATGKSGKELFVTTNGGLGGKIGGTFVEGGEVVGVRL